MVQSQIVGWVHILKTKRPDRRYLRDVLAGLCPVEMERVAGENDHASRRKCLHPVAVKGFAQTNVEDARHDRIDPILRMPMRHQLCSAWRLNPDHVRAGLGGVADDDGKAHRRWNRRKGLPGDVFGQDRSESGLVGLMRAGHVGHRYFVICIIAVDLPRVLGQWVISMARSVCHHIGSWKRRGATWRAARRSIKVGAIV